LQREELRLRAGVEARPYVYTKYVSRGICEREWKPVSLNTNSHIGNVLILDSIFRSSASGFKSPPAPL